MSDKKVFVRSVKNILKLKICKLTILLRGARVEKRTLKIVKCFVLIAIGKRVIYS